MVTQVSLSGGNIQFSHVHNMTSNDQASLSAAPAPLPMTLQPAATPLLLTMESSTHLEEITSSDEMHLDV